MHTKFSMPRVRGSARDRGFTLIEMIIVIVLTSIIASAVAVFIKLPVQGYVDTARRAEMSDEADTALRRLGRDLRLALPNSVRVTDSGATIEILLTKIGGRYRIESEGTATADALNFSATDTLFDQLGPLSVLNGQSIAINSDSVVIYNLGPGVVSADAYNGLNRSRITGLPGSAMANEQWIQIDPMQFPLESPGNRFQVIEGPVSYVCANGTLTRYWGYAITPTQQSAATLAASAASRALAASNVAPGLASCRFVYAPGVTERAGLVALTLTLTRGVESVRLYHEVHVSNVP